MEVKYKHHKPEIFEECAKRFGVNWDTVVITYGNTVYSKFEISPDLKAHESIHVGQQTTMGPKEWWDKYLIDAQFRLDQELPAYKAQLAYAKENYPRAQRRMLERHIYKSMARDYGEMVTEEEAKQLCQKQ